MASVTIDLWHTLIYLEPEDEEAYMQAQVSIATEVLASSPLRPGASGSTREELGRAFEREYARAVAESGQGYTVTPAEQLERAARSTGRDASPDRYLRGLAEEIDRLPFERAPRAFGFLDALKGDGYHLGLISNTVGEPGRFLRPVLERMGFQPYFETYVFSDEHPWTKPSPEIFRAALAGLGDPPNRAVHVGDGWSDVEGAKRAGLRAAILYTELNHYGARYKELFLPPGWDRPETEHVAANLEEALTEIRGLLPAV